MSGRNEFSVFIDDAQRQQRAARSVRELLRRLPSRSHRQHQPRLVRALAHAQPAVSRTKVIARERHVPWIVDSIEQRVQQNPFSPSSIFNSSHGGTVYTRANGIAGADGMLGYAYDALKEACYGAHADKLLLVQYETLTTDPAKVLAAIYDFLGEPEFKHDFTQVDYDARAFGAKAGTPALHDVRPAVAAIERPTLLPPDLPQRFANDAFWRDPARHPAAVRLV